MIPSILNHGIIISRFSKPYYLYVFDVYRSTCRFHYFYINQNAPYVPLSLSLSFQSLTHGTHISSSSSSFPWPFCLFPQPFSLSLSKMTQSDRARLQVVLSWPVLRTQSDWAELYGRWTKVCEGVILSPSQLYSLLIKVFWFFGMIFLINRISSVFLLIKIQKNISFYCPLKKKQQKSSRCQKPIA